MLNTIAAFVKDKDTHKAVLLYAKSHSFATDAIKLGDIKTATNFYKTKKTPDLLIVEVTNQEKAATELANLANNCDENTNVIVVGDSNDFSFVKQLLDLGVAEYLLNPVSVEHLENSILKIQGVNPTKKCKTTIVAGSKGGVGTSTVVANLAGLLANKFGKKTAVFDGNYKFGCFNSLFGQDINNDFLEVLKDPKRVDEVLLKRVATVVNDNLSLFAIEPELNALPPIHRDAIPEFAKLLNDNFDHIIMDLDRRNLDQLPDFDNLIIVTDLSFVGVRDTVRIYDFLKNETGKNIQIIVNKKGAIKTLEIEPTEIEKVIGTEVKYKVPFSKEVFGLYYGDASYKKYVKSSMSEELIKLCCDSFYYCEEKKGFLSKLIK